MRYDKLVKLILRKYECRRCGKCCDIPPMVNMEEIQRISKELGISSRTFILVYTVIRSEGKPYLTNPCPFRVGKNQCSIYKFRPKVCRYFPFQVDVPVIAAVEWCSMAKEMYDIVANTFPLGDEKDVPDILKLREKVADKISPIINERWVNERMKCLAVPLKELKYLLDEGKRRKKIRQRSAKNVR